MKLCAILAATLAFVVGLTVPAVATTITTAWETVHSNPGTNCTIGRAVLNNTAGNAGSTVRSKATCSESASDVNLPADRMGVAAYANDLYGYACSASGTYVNNADGTAVKSVTNAVYCSGYVEGWGYQRRKVNATDWVYEFAITDLLYF